MSDGQDVAKPELVIFSSGKVADLALQTRSEMNSRDAAFT